MTKKLDELIKGLQKALNRRIETVDKWIFKNNMAFGYTKNGKFVCAIPKINYDMLVKNHD